MKGVNVGDEVRKKEPSYDAELETPDLEEIKQKDKERLRHLRRQQKEALLRARMQQNQLVEAEEGQAKSDRLKYLLAQTEIFTHFIKGGGETDTQVHQRETGKKRGRLTEQEEDEKILDEELREDEESRATRWITNSPSWIEGGTLRDYQVEGVNWLVNLYQNGINGILADEMGLGKTLQSITLLGYLKHERGLGGPHMVIVPKTTLSNWMNEFRKWCPSMEVLKFHGNKEERAELRQQQLLPGAFEVLVTTYEMAVKEKAALAKFSWRYIIIDEAHRIKNENSILSQVVRIYKSQFRLLLTGTPLQNNLHELWALLNFLLPEVFSSSEDFDSWFNLERHPQGDSESGNSTTGSADEIVSKLHMVLRPFLLRRLKADVERNLPPKKEIKLFVGMSKMQKEWYLKILTRDIEAINGVVKGKAGRMRLLNLVMQLRKACNHPYLFEGAEPGPPYEEGEHLVANAGKLVLLDKLLPKLQAQDSRVLIFSQMTRLLDILEDYLVMRGYDYRRIDGSSQTLDRESAIDDFNASGSPVFVFLLSTRAGGLGINLATADTVILYDSDWNPQVDLQAQDRAHRIGQTKPVTVFRFVTDGSIEEKIIERAEAKLHLDAVVIQQGRLAEKNKTLGEDELLSMIRFGADEIFKSRDSTITDEDIDLIISRGAQRTEELNDKLQSNAKTLLDFSLGGANPQASLYEFQGVDYSTEARGSRKKLSWLKLPSRTRKVAKDYSVDGYYRGVMRAEKSSKKPSAVKALKQPIVHDFQFFPPRLHDLLNKEAAALRAKAECRKEPPKDDQFVEEDTDFGGLTKEEEEEKESLLAEGFGNWNRREFNTFVKACERYGRWDLDNIAASLQETKSRAEVESYSNAFWETAEDALSQDWPRILANIEKGEAKLRRREEMATILASVVGPYTCSWWQLTLTYTGGKSRIYTQQEDQFILCMTNKLGYGNWEQLQQEIRQSWQFRFDWFLKSRTPQELGRRCDTLIKMFEKMDNQVSARRKTVKKGSISSSSSKRSHHPTNQQSVSKRHKIAT